MNAPTEAEVRHLITARIEAPEGSSGDPGGDLRNSLRGVIHDAGQWVRHPAWYSLDVTPDDAGTEWNEQDLDGDPPLWIELRRSEARRLRDLLREAEERAVARCEAIILDELTAAGVAFAAEFPEAPRPRAMEAVR
jgi:hypothetical protein